MAWKAPEPVSFKMKIRHVLDPDSLPLPTLTRAIILGPTTNMSPAVALVRSGWGLTAAAAGER
jgi:hypothetical protein